MLSDPTPAPSRPRFAGSLAARGFLRPARAGSAQPRAQRLARGGARLQAGVHAELDAIVAVVRRLLPALIESDAIDLIAAATSLSGAFWQMATPGPSRRPLSERSSARPRCGRRRPRLQRILTALIKGLLAAR